MIPLRQEDSTPMMNELEINLVKQLLNTKSNGRVLEWGSGNSTIYFPKHCPIKTWTSIEHNLEFVQYLSHMINPETTSVFWLPENTYYFNAVADQLNYYDFILIDGRLREECTKIAMTIAKLDSIILLHDAGREEYQPFINKYPHKVLSQGEIKTETGFYKHRGLVQFLP